MRIRGEERRESKSIMRSNIKLLLLQESISLSKKYHQLIVLIALFETLEDS
jgi:hypothetical protein